MIRRHLDHRLRPQHFRAVAAINDHRSLLKASAALGVGQPALTKLLQELEEIVGHKLFLRQPRGVVPTDAGLLFVDASRRVSGELRRLDGELDRLDHAQGGIVSIGALPVTASGVLPGALARLRRDHPHIEIRLSQGRTDEMLPLLAANEIDLIIGRHYEPAVPDRFQRIVLWDEPIALLARPGHPLLRAAKGPVSDIGAFDLVLPTISQRVGREIDAVLSMLGLDASRALRSSSYSFIREMLHASDAISVMPRLMMAGDLIRGSLRVLPLMRALQPRPAGLVIQPNGFRPAVQLFVDCLHRHLADIEQLGLGPLFPPVIAPAK